MTDKLVNACKILANHNLEFLYVTLINSRVISWLAGRGLS